MLYRTLIPVAALAVAACSAQNARPPPEEPTSTTSVTSAALTTSTTMTTVTSREAALPEAKTPLAPRFREALARNPALEGVPHEHIQVEQIGGHVTLRGRMPTVADAVQVEMSVRQVKGVTSVTNEIRPLR